MNMQHDESTFTKETINVQNEHCVKSTDQRVKVFSSPKKKKTITIVVETRQDTHT